MLQRIPTAPTLLLLIFQSKIDALQQFGMDKSDCGFESREGKMSPWGKKITFKLNERGDEKKKTH